MQTWLKCVANAQSFLSFSCDDTTAVLRTPGEFQEVKSLLIKKSCSSLLMVKFYAFTASKSNEKVLSLVTAVSE